MTFDLDGLVGTGNVAGRSFFLLQWPRDNAGELSPAPGGEANMTARGGGVASMCVTSDFAVRSDVTLAEALAVMADGTA